MSFIEVFKTNVQTTATALHITAALSHLFPNYQINFDLEDEENVLRIDGRDKEVDAGEVIKILHKNGCQCALLL